MLRYRKLIPHGPRDAPADTAIPLYGEGAFLQAGIALAGGVQQVAAEEGEASAPALEQLLKAKALMPTDLVFSHGQWRSFEDAPEFSDLCRGLVDTRALKATLRSAAIVIAFVLAAVAANVLLFWLD